jgi:pyrimidine operon attenuation protein / uracil phosphoribosyltransferase
MVILEHSKVLQKVNRLAVEIEEHHFDSKEIYLIGINNRGKKLAEMLKSEIEKRDRLIVHFGTLDISPSNPFEFPIDLSIPVDQIATKKVILVDDVANTGRTLFYAFQPFMNHLLHRLEICVLVDRMHKSFPIKCDYVGMTLATTFQENIFVDILEKEEFRVTLV